MAAYSIEITVLNLSRSSVELRTSVIVERNDLESALVKGAEAIIRDAAIIGIGSRKRVRGALSRLVAELTPEYASTQTKPVAGKETACSKGTGRSTSVPEQGGLPAPSSPRRRQAPLPG